MNRSSLCCVLAAALVLSSATVATAATKYWKNSAGSGSWSNGANWSNISAAGADVVSAPGINDTVNVSPTDGAARTIIYDASAILTYLTVDLTGAGTNRTTFNMNSGGNLTTADGIIVGDNGRATFNHSAGTLLYSNPSLDAVVGFHAGGDGIYNLSGTGALSVARGLYIGTFASSTGAFNQTGGTNNVQSLILGANVGATGTYTISGGTVTAATDIYVGNFGTGTMTVQNGGSVSVASNLSINGTSTLNLNGGTLRFNTVSGLNRLNFNSGTIKLAGNRDLGSDDTIAFLFGPLLAPPASITIPIGKALHVEGNASLNQPNKTVTVDGGSLTSFNLNVGTFINSVGTMIVTNGGTVTSTSNATLAQDSGSQGVVTVSGPGSTWNIANDLTVGTNGSATLNIRDHSYVSVGNHLNIGPSGVINLEGGTLRFGVNNLPSGLSRLNLTYGTIQLAGDRNIGVDPILNALFGIVPTLDAGFGLAAEGTATISTALTLNGGTLRANSLVVNGSLHFGGGLLELTGGTITGLSGLAIPTNGEFRASGVQAVRVTGAAGSTITATGNLTLGNAAAVNGFGTQGTLQTGANTVTLLDANDAVFDSLSLTTLGAGAGPGAISAANGLTLDFGGNFTGFGTVTTPNNVAKPLINNGHITGNSGAQRITLPGYVKGAGTFDNVNFTGTFSPGLSPALTIVGSISLTPINTLIMELGGTSRGGQYDAILGSGNLGLGGVMNVTLIDGFNPAAGHTFDLFDWATLSGTFSSINLPALTAGLAWNTSLLYSTGVLSVMTPGFQAADFDEDGDVDGADLTLWRNNFGTGANHMQGDADGDLDVDGHDFLTWQRQLGSPSAIAASTPVPEPLTAVLFAMGFAAVGILMRRGA